MAQTTLYLLPISPQMKVPMPDGSGPLPLLGAEVPRSPYWLRRLRDGDVRVGTAPAEGSKPAAAAPGEATSKKTTKAASEPAPTKE